MRTTGGGAGAAAVAERKFYLHFTINLPTDKGNHGRGGGGANRQDHQLLFVITKPPNKRGKPHNILGSGGMRLCTAKLFMTHEYAHEYFKKRYGFPFGKIN